MRKTYRLTKGGGHWHLTIWVNGACAGDLCVRDDERQVLDEIVVGLRANGAREVE